MKLIQISDTHIDEPETLVHGHFDTAGALARAVAVINAMQPAPDLVLHTGDIASHGSVPRYEAFRDIASKLTAPMPGSANRAR
jgi:3',5'-cyclic AMP phosphodiesterase CpdA|tara:strand:- start:141 stop:389 length:249 start_codon:yes stop_codon:yes gene_type:complete